MAVTEKEKRFIIAGIINGMNIAYNYAKGDEERLRELIILTALTFTSKYPDIDDFVNGYKDEVRKELDATFMDILRVLDGSSETEDNKNCSTKEN